MDEAEEALRMQFAGEFGVLASSTDSVPVALTPFEAWIVMQNLQLALKHPANRGATSDVARNVARRLQALVAPEGALAVVAEQGWHREPNE